MEEMGLDYVDRFFEGNDICDVLSVLIVSFLDLMETLQSWVLLGLRKF